MKGKTFFFLVVVVVLGLQNQAHAQKFSGRRFALLIGNSKYEHGLLKNPVNDTKAVASALENLEFEVTNLNNQDRRQMIRAISKFTDKLKAGDLCLFFYAGHGMQIDGTNYLVPLKAEVEKEADVEFECMPLNRVMANLEQSNCSIKILVLDCCRDNPLSRSFSRSKKRGLGAVADQPDGTIIAFSTKPGEVASDGDGDTSPYTESLIGVLKDQRSSGLELIDVFRTTAQKVAEKTGQRPFIRFDGAMDRVFLLNQIYSTADAKKKRQDASKPSTEKKTPFAEKLKIDFSQIPAGSFMMGGEESLESLYENFPGELYADCHTRSYPQHKVTLTRPFYISKYETTIGQFRAFVEDTGYQTERERGVRITSGLPITWEKSLQWNSSRHFNVTDKYPVTFVSWNDAQAYCRWLSKKMDKPVSLPTQAQWEYACRANSNKRFSFGNDTRNITHFANVPSRPKVNEIEVEGGGSSLLLHLKKGVNGKIQAGGDSQLFVEQTRNNDDSITVENASNVVLTVGGKTVPQGTTVKLDPEQVQSPFTASLHFKNGPNSKWQFQTFPQGGRVTFFREPQGDWRARHAGFSIAELAKTDQLEVRNDDQTETVQIKTADGTISIAPGQLETVKAKLSGYWAVEEDGFPNQLAPVGQFEPNKFGLFDMHGNVWEWCQDGYDLDYSEKLEVDPKGSKHTDLYAIRGGCYL